MKSRWGISTLLLFVTTFSVQAATSQTCRVYFKEADKFLQYIATRDDLKQNMPEIKGNFEQNKKLISSSTLKSKKQFVKKECKSLITLTRCLVQKKLQQKININND